MLLNADHDELSTKGNHSGGTGQRTSDKCLKQKQKDATLNFRCIPQVNGVKYSTKVVTEQHKVKQGRDSAGERSGKCVFKWLGLQVEHGVLVEHSRCVFINIGVRVCMCFIRVRIYNLLPQDDLQGINQINLASAVSSVLAILF